MLTRKYQHNVLIFSESMHVGIDPSIEIQVRHTPDIVPMQLSMVDVTFGPLSATNCDGRGVNRRYQIGRTRQSRVDACAGATKKLPVHFIILLTPEGVIDDGGRSGRSGLLTGDDWRHSSTLE